MNGFGIVLILIKNQFIHGLGKQLPEDTRGCGLRGVDLFPNNVLIILRLLKVDCDMGQTRWNASRGVTDSRGEIQTETSQTDEI